MGDGYGVGVGDAVELIDTVLAVLLDEEVEVPDEAVDVPGSLGKWGLIARSRISVL